MDNVDTVKGKVGDALRANLSHVVLNRELTELERSVPLAQTPDSLRMQPWDRDQIHRLFDDLEFRVLRDRLFDTLADLRNETQWNSRVSSAELRSTEPVGPGSRFAIVNGGTPYDVTITTYDRPSRLILEASGKPELTIAYALAPAGEGTQLASEFDFRPRGALKVLFLVLGPVIRRDIPKQYASLKALCER